MNGNLCAMNRSVLGAVMGVGALLAGVGVGAASAGLSVSATGLGRAQADVWGAPNSPPNPPTHSLAVQMLYPAIVLGPNLGGCDPRTFVDISTQSPQPFTYRFGVDGRAYGGDTIAADGLDLYQYVTPSSVASSGSIDIIETISETSIHLFGTMILSDDGGAARMRLIDGSDPLEPRIIYEDLFINPSGQPERIIDLTIPIPSGGPDALRIDLDVCLSSLPTPGTAMLLGLGGMAAARRRR